MIKTLFIIIAMMLLIQVLPADEIKVNEKTVSIKVTGLAKVKPEKVQVVLVTEFAAKDVKEGREKLENMLAVFSFWEIVEIKGKRTSGYKSSYFDPKSSNYKQVAPPKTSYNRYSPPRVNPNPYLRNKETSKEITKVEEKVWHNFNMTIEKTGIDKLSDQEINDLLLQVVKKLPCEIVRVHFHSNNDKEAQKKALENAIAKIEENKKLLSNMGMKLGKITKMELRDGNANYYRTPTYNSPSYNTFNNSIKTIPFYDNNHFHISLSPSYSTISVSIIAEFARK